MDEILKAVEHMSPEEIRELIMALWLVHDSKGGANDLG